jgi:hypothetical protein
MKPLLLLLAFQTASVAFVVRPDVLVRNHQVQEKPCASSAIMETTMPPMVASCCSSRPTLLFVLHASSSSSSDASSKKENKNFLTKAINKISSLWQKKKKDDDDDDVAILSRHDEGVQLANEMREALVPWPLRDVESLTRTIGRGLAGEERKAKPLLREATSLIKGDDDVCQALGEPIKFGHIVSQSSETTVSMIDNKRTKVQRIVDTFEVEGSKENGIAILAADKYARGHIQKLRVNVKGIHYDIDVE